MTTGSKGSWRRRQFISKMRAYSSTVGFFAKILYGMRRRNASSASDSGFRLVAKTMSTSKGSWNFLPVCSVR